MFKKVLVANRGEIAVRILRALRGLRIGSVTLSSDVDEKALHRRLADESYPLGDPAPRQSYLNIEKILKVAKQAKVDAIHPGYGFLSENPLFAKACHEAGIVFIGPTAEAIQKMGDKIGAKTFLKQHGIPVIPGREEPLRDPDKARCLAEEIGYPILLKASAGGGGKGMRIVRKEADLTAALEGAQREAQGAFGDDRVFIEKYIENPRHIEFQILADSYGEVIHLFERECSLQRRYQKVVEESPSPFVGPSLRQKMGETAIKIAQLIGYTNAGTVEFVVDSEGEFYFLEMNTRLQVEHPITEMVTGLDLVQAQIRIAQGERLEEILGQARRGDAPVGHAIECRLYAEDPENDFLPSVGKISHLREPAGEGIRIDSGIYEGWSVPLEYDPLLAKLIVHAPTRRAALLKMVHALGQYRMEGLKTNLSFLIDLLRHPAVIQGETETGLIAKYFDPWSPSPYSSEDPYSPWNSEVGWSLWGVLQKEGQEEREKKFRGARRQEFLATHRTSSPSGHSEEAVAPMPGTIRKIFVKEGQEVARGEPLVVVEAMKMEHSIEAPRDGIIKKIYYLVGERVGMGEKLVEISKEGPAG